MSDEERPERKVTRRKFLSLAGGALAAGGAAGLAAPAQAATGSQHGSAPVPAVVASIEPFYGKCQGGIVTPTQKHTYFAAFDLLAEQREDVIELLRNWTAAAARLSVGQTAKLIAADPNQTAGDGGAAIGLPPQRLTITFGFGAGLFESDGHDRYGLKNRRPAAFVDLPRFPGDELVDAATGGDLSVQACSDDPQVAFHAVRELARVCYGAAQLRWAQSGFVPNTVAKDTPRNLMGFKDGTVNPSISNPLDMDKFVWVGKEGPEWMHGGSYLVARRIRIALDHWDRMTVAFQEQTVGRHKYSGAPLGCPHEFDALDLDATDKDGNLVIPDSAHVRLATAATNDGARILRRPYSYNDGVTFTAERWPPWRQGMAYDAGLFFMAYQRDPRTGFIKIFDNMSKLDALNQFTTHVGGGIFACPGGVRPGEYIGQRLFAAG